jgi:hypothetical protein
MILGMIVFFIVIGFGVLTHGTPRFEQKIYKHIPLYDWLLITLFPIGCYIATALFVRTIMLRNTMPILPFGDVEILIAGVLIVVYAVSGNSIHFTSKVLWRYLDKDLQKTAYEVNELFHGKFSHLLTFVGVLLILFCISLLEMNHPVLEPINESTRKGIVFMSIFTGVFVAKMVVKSRSNDLSWRINRPLFAVGFLVGVLHLYIVYILNLDLYFYPFNLYTLLFLSTFITGFLLRKLYFFSRHKLFV